MFKLIFTILFIKHQHGFQIGNNLFSWSFYRGSCIKLSARCACMWSIGATDTSFVSSKWFIGIACFYSLVLFSACFVYYNFDSLINHLDFIIIILSMSFISTSLIINFSIGVDGGNVSWYIGFSFNDCSVKSLGN